MNIDNVEKIFQLFDKSNSQKLDFESNEFSIKLEKKTSSLENIIENNDLTIENSKNNDEHWIKSPLVGTYYSKKNPESNDFITVGKKVKKGDIICIVEAMKVMNEIRSDIDGTVIKINCKNEDIVEYNQDLVLIGEENDK